MSELKAHIPEILERLTNGESLRAICRTDGFPSEGTVRLWEREDQDFATQYARARDIGCERLADELLSIADDGTNDTFTDKDGNSRTDYDVIARSRLRVDTRKWLLSKMLPKKYGERIELAGEVKTDNTIHITREVISKSTP